jgi:hypothetical protein
MKPRSLAMLLVVLVALSMGVQDAQGKEPKVMT